MNARTIFSGVLLLLMAGCAHVRPDGGTWGSGEGVTPSPARAPALSAATRHIKNTDKVNAGDARRVKPQFDSSQTVADLLQLGVLGLYIGLRLASPGPEEPGEWWPSKIGGFPGGASAIGGSHGLMSGTGHIRLDREDNHRLSSGYAAAMVTAMSLTANVLDYYTLDRSSRFAAHTGLVDLTAWKRLGAGKYNPADVILGHVLGNFIARYTPAALLRPVLGESIGFTTEWLPNGGVFSLYMIY
ncbi:MAG: hypothetical protein WD750_05515 [Gammaproteobacteria bacterium]